MVCLPDQNGIIESASTHFKYSEDKVDEFVLIKDGDTWRLEEPIKLSGEAIVAVSLLSKNGISQLSNGGAYLSGGNFMDSDTTLFFEITTKADGDVESVEFAKYDFDVLGCDQDN